MICTFYIYMCYNYYGEDMKIYRNLFIFIFLVIMLCGCSKDEYITCDINVRNNVDDYELVGTYKIYYKDNYVTKIEKDEKYTSINQDEINLLYESKNLEYYSLNDKYGGYTYNIKKEDNEVNINTYIDLENINIKKMVKDNYIDSDYVSLKGLKLGGIKYFYRDRGAICSE